MSNMNHSGEDDNDNDAIDEDEHSLRPSTRPVRNIFHDDDVHNANAIK